MSRYSGGCQSPQFSSVNLSNAQRHSQSSSKLSWSWSAWNLKTQWIPHLQTRDACIQAKVLCPEFTHHFTTAHISGFHLSWLPSNYKPEFILSLRSYIVREKSKIHTPVIFVFMYESWETVATFDILTVESFYTGCLIVGPDRVRIPCH